jgi:para-nitrobenzyl esterase
MAQHYVDDTEAGHRFSSREVVNQLLIKGGKATDRAAAKAAQDAMPAADVGPWLRAHSATDIMALYNGSSFGMINWPNLFADGYVLPAESDPAKLFADPAKYNAVPVMIGTNRDEMALFMVRDPHWVTTRFWIFPRLEDPGAYERAVSYQSQAWKIRGVDDIARLLVQAQPGKVFAYRFDWDEEPSIMGYDLSKALGAAHGLEIAFAFGNFEGGLARADLYPKSAARDALSTSMMSYWTEFAFNGDPGDGRDHKEVKWLPWGTDNQRMLILDTAGDGGIRMSGEELTVSGLKQRLRDDPSITDQHERCGLYATVFRYGAFDQNEYLNLGAGGCAAYDPESFRTF